MRLLLIHRYFWPDPPPYASMLRSIGLSLADRGHVVRIVTGRTVRRGVPRTTRPGLTDSMTVDRLPVAPEDGPGPGKLVNMVVFPILVAARVLKGPRPDVVMCSTAPQVTLGFAVSWAARRRSARFVYHCMDLHPEIGRLSGEFANPLLFRVLARMDLVTMHRAAAIVVLSGDMRRAVLRRDPALAPKVVVLNNFALPEFDEPGEPPLADPAPGVLRVVFTGNLGRFQGLEDAVEAVKTLPPQTRVELVFMGAGVVRSDLEAAAADRPLDGASTIVFLPQGPVRDARALMRSAHVGLVSLVPGIVDYAYPSKTATYAEEGLPILAVCEPDSELATTVRARGLGWTATPGDVPGLAAALTAAYAMLIAEHGHHAVRDRVSAYAVESFSEASALPRWAELVESLAAREAIGG